MKVIFNSENKKDSIFRKKIIFNTIKIFLASMLAIIVAQLLNLQFAVAAGIIAILSVQPTKKETLNTAIGRLLAYLCAVVISFAAFKVIGFNTLAFGVYLSLFILICQHFGWISAMAMDSVLISHFLSVGSMSLEMVVNETLIFIIGVGFGVIANLHLHKDSDRMDKLEEEMDEQIRKILFRMSERILTEDYSDYNGQCFEVLSAVLSKAENMADTNYMNQFQTGDRYDIEYVHMRKEQCQVLYEMYKNIRKLTTTPAQAKRISEFLEKVSVEYHKLNAVDSLMDEFFELDLSMKNEPLPVAREEFENRARLFALLRQIEEFLVIKKDFIQYQ